MLTLEDIHSEVLLHLAQHPDGDSLDVPTAALIAFAVRASVTTLDMASSEAFIDEAIRAGATGDQLHEALVLVSGLGVHSLMEGSARLARLAEESRPEAPAVELSEEQRRLWQTYVGDNPYWQEVEKQMPGFLKGLLQMSPLAFEAFFLYCAVPWKSKHLTSLTKELISIAVDASTTHRYMPGLRLHLANALKLGAGRRAILETLAIAAHAPPHFGVR
jgi:alkylhydroperoxidase/carboxymuconolactone decarboxylase family protein YurZ